MESLSYLLDNAPRVSTSLPNHDGYLAHLPSETFRGKLDDETLAEHMKLVFQCANRLSQIHGIDSVVDTLITDMVSRHSPTYNHLLSDYVKRLFVDAIAFHDFGKVNQHFQRERMQNKLFQQTYNTLFKPAYGHSELGAYLFAVYHLEAIDQLPIPEDDESEKVWLSTVALLFSVPILLHHNGQFEALPKRFKRSQFLDLLPQLNRYVQLYRFSEPDISLAYFESWEQIWSDFTDYQKDNNFSLFALLRLNFSLLTAADYLATSEYMNQAGVEDLGILTDDVKKHISQATRTSKSYNADAFRLADQPDWQPILPDERSNDALNQLRLTMVVEVVRSVRANADKRLFYLEAPTGGGKTNLSMLATAELLRLSPELNKVFYVFPFTTLITQTHKAILETWQLSESEVGLLHSKAGFQQKEEQGEGKYGQAWRNQMHNQFAHFPVCLLTHIRFFDMLKSDRKENIYLMHRLANSVVIIDELQSYPPQHWDKMLFWIDQYARYFNVHFVLMSATLPRIDTLKIPLANQPDFCDLLPKAKDYFINPNFRDRVRFRFDLLDNSAKNARSRTVRIDEVAQAVLTESERYAEAHDGRVFTMVEFIYKKSATEFATLLDGQFFDDVLVLSGTILEPRRREVINYLKRNAKAQRKILLVTTQVVEAGVDIDMDLGFKNVSLIDSDEQLAGRINRNVTKDVCEVFLFRLNEPGILYQKDDRFAMTRDSLTLDDHKTILHTKDFGKLYDLVIEYRDKVNNVVEIDNFNSQYLPTIQTLNYPEASDLFRLIDAHNLSMFVPLSLPIHIGGVEKDESEAIFSLVELAFLEQNKVYEVGDERVDGEAVWTLFRSLNKLNASFSDRQVNKKIMQGILAKFTFSIFYTEALKNELCPRFTGPEEDGFPEYLYLRHYDEVYVYNTGLDQLKFTDSANSIL